MGESAAPSRPLATGGEADDGAHPVVTLPGDPGRSAARTLPFRTASAVFARIGSRVRVHSDTRRALAVWLVSRLAYALASVFIAASGVPSWVPVAPGTPRVVVDVAATPHDVLYRWWFWDAGFYISIANRGYYAPAKTAWFPLYPIVIAAVHHVLPIDSLVIALLVSNLAGLAAMIALAHLARRTLGPRGVVPVLVLLAAYPVAWFLAAAYSDSLALALMLWSLLWGLRGRWPLSLCAAFLAGLTRPTAVLLILPLLAVYAQQQEWGNWLRLALERLAAAWRRWRGRSRARWEAQPTGEPRAGFRPGALVRATMIPLAIVAAIPAAWACYAIYCARAFGQPLLFLTIQSSQDYGHGLTWPWQSLALAAQEVGGAAPGSYLQLRLLVDVIPVVAFTVCALFVLFLLARPVVARLAGNRELAAGAAPPLPWYWIIWLLGATLQVLCVATVAPSAPDVYVSDCRYLLVAVPLPILLAGALLRARSEWTGRVILAALVATGVVTQIVLLAFELNHGWLV